MLIFQNKGVIPEDAITISGVSAKVIDNPIGQFGTGLKYAIALVLRAGGSIKIWRGKKLLTFDLVKSEIRGKPFNIVTMNGKKLGFTDQLGLNWKPWMIYRELFSNCRDEGGSILQVVPSGSEDELGKAGFTKILVELPELEVIHGDRNNIILPTESHFQLNGIHVHDGSTKSLFYRGIRVMEFDKKPSLFTYNLQSQQTLTEDRTLAYQWSVPGLIAKAIISSTSKAFLRKVLDADIVKNHYEETLSYESVKHETPSLEFLETAEALLGEKRLVGVARSLFGHYQDSMPGYVSPYILEEFTATQIEIIDKATTLVRAKFPNFSRSIVQFKTKQLQPVSAAKEHIIISADVIPQGTWAVARAMVLGLATLQKGGITQQLTHFVLTGGWLPEELTDSYNAAADNFEEVF
jgi:hypothetical protein